MQSLLRLPQVFAHLHQTILHQLGAKNPKQLGKEIYLTENEIVLQRQTAAAAPFVSWHIPIHHSWPCHPPDVADFPEKAVQALARKFAAHQPQSVLFAATTAGGPQDRYRSIAKQMRARAVQVFSPHGALPADQQHPDHTSLFALLGKHGLYAGIASPQQANGYHPGVRVFLSHADVISRAGCKIIEALQRLALAHLALPEKAHWLELGASPGGMTTELLTRGYQVSAVDRALLDPRLANHPHLDFQLADAASYPVKTSPTYHAILCDMNGSCHDAFAAVARQLPALRANGLVIFTLKGHGLDTFDDWLTREAHIQLQSKTHGLTVVDRVHLTHNRREFTLVWQKP